MNNTLETRLAEYGTKNPIRCDRELIAALGAIIESERGKRTCDFDLVDEAVTFLCELSGKNTEPPESLTALPRTASASHRGAVAKWALPAAAVTAILAGAAVGGVLRADEPEMSDGLKEEIMSMEPGDSFETDGWDVAAGHDRYDVGTLDELIEEMADSGIMIPRPDGYDVAVARFEDYGRYLVIGLDVTGENGRSEVEIRTEDVFRETPETYRVGRFDVALFTYDDPAMTGNVIYQGSFVYNGVTYNVWSPSEDDLERIILSFEEIGQ